MPVLFLVLAVRLQESSSGRRWGRHFELVMNGSCEPSDGQVPSVPRKSLILNSVPCVTSMESVHAASASACMVMDGLDEKDAVCMSRHPRE